MHSIQGFIDGKSYYTMEGKDYVKASSAPDKERLTHDPAYAKVRQNNHLFASVSAMVKTFRTALQDSFEDAMNKRIHGHLLSEFRKMAMASLGSPVFNLRQHTKALQAIRFHDQRLFDPAAYMPFVLRWTKNRQKLSMELQPFKHRKQKQENKRTHFRMKVGVLPFADHTAHITEEAIRLEQLTNPMHGKLICIESDYLDVRELKEKILLTLLVPPEASRKNISLIVILHLSFYEQVNGTMYLFEGDSVMKVVEVV